MNAVSSDLTANQIWALHCTPFWGLRPGDNLWPEISLVPRSWKELKRKDCSECRGEDIDLLIRHGFLHADERDSGFPVLHHSEGFDLECRFRFTLTDKGLAVVSNT
jgi:hypothetical protein